MSAEKYPSHPGLPSYVETCRPGQPHRRYSYDKTQYSEEESELFWGTATTLFETDDPRADYSYDDSALVKVVHEYENAPPQTKYYFINTSGCSCPSPSETWSVVWTAATLEEAATKWLNGRSVEELEENPMSRYGWPVHSPAEREIFLAFRAHGLL